MGGSVVWIALTEDEIQQIITRSGFAPELVVGVDCRVSAGFSHDDGPPQEFTSRKTCMGRSTENGVVPVYEIMRVDKPTGAEVPCRMNAAFLPLADAVRDV